MSKLVEKPKRTLPGRVYTMVVTALATILVATPVMFGMNSRWSAVAEVQHTPLQGDDSAQKAVRRQAAAAAKTAGIVSQSADGHANLVENLQVTTMAGKVPNARLTSIEFQHANRKQARQFVQSLAQELKNEITTKRGRATVSTVQVSRSGHIPKGRFTILVTYALVMGIVTWFFPRPSHASADGKTPLDEVSEAAEAPIMATVLPAKTAKPLRKSSNLPLRLSTLCAEIVVLFAFAIVVVNAATTRHFQSQIKKDPLGTYAQSIRTTSAHFQALFDR